ncbi:hypothetical protein Pmani_029918 [Petrolisthes manimaculis]|uniref:SRPBCC family protein n=1 Tax=Petrolisthes manimaculis TaxID=1843537 RepID=A0AAE1TTE7_9EUCA|nr:hypothetical protein Pmani_029918 [Petrolisthes manimaculis]
MVSKLQVIIALLFGVVGVLYQVTVDTTTWAAKQQGSLFTSPDMLQRFITNPDQVQKWFPMVSQFKSADSRPFGVGKKYQAIYDLPILGEYVMLLSVVEYKINHIITLESNSFLRPTFTINMVEKAPNNTILTFSMEYKRSSALFQWTLGPLLQFLTRQQMQRSLFQLRLIFPI